ncbi:clusterin-associated protein 1-like [Clytia hemisphaerica]|uniref:Clusterin associated protein 1 n=1 Tax=Clytia hemisphaerica TaxID=252671 RepID=A0A7M5X3B5_9CNID|eukprot:TCONS_00022564-protein
MSYRDIRNFTEMMRALGYPRLISMENFRNPNFSLVAEILKWLVLRYDPNTDIPMDVDTENDRVLFIKSVAQFMMTKAHIKLNTKKLYGADGLAVKELLKVTTVLYDATQKSKKSDEDEMAASYLPRKVDFNSKISELKMARQLASEITVKGSTLHQLLGREVDLREIRTASVARPLDLNEIEKNIENAVNEAQSDLDKTRNQLDNIASDEANLGAKIEKRTAELERNQKRLKNLESVRPAFMDEYEGLEKDLETLYKTYIEKYRNLTYLEQQHEIMNKTELDKFNDSDNPLKAAMRAREEHEDMIRRRLDSAGSETDGEEEDEDVLVADNDHPVKQGKPKVVGSMAGALDSDDDDSGDLSSGSEGVEDGLLDDDDETGSDDEDDDDQIQTGGGDSDDGF